jgi:hypothetical protein
MPRARDIQWPRTVKLSRLQPAVRLQSSPSRSVDPQRRAPHLILWPHASGSIRGSLLYAYCLSGRVVIWKCFSARLAQQHPAQGAPEQIQPGGPGWDCCYAMKRGSPRIHSPFIPSGLCWARSATRRRHRLSFLLSPQRSIRNGDHHRLGEASTPDPFRRHSGRAPVRCRGLARIVVAWGLGNPPELGHRC